MGTVPKSEWAIEKVRVYLPPSKEKSTLMAIAGYVNHVTGTARPSRDAIAHDSGHSGRTVQRHIQSLERAGHLVVDRESKNEHRPSVYRIPCCSLSLQELEFITGIDGEQLLLGVVTPDQPGTVVVVADTWKTLDERRWETDCHPMGDKLAPNGSQTDSPTWSNMGKQKAQGQISLKNGEKVKLKRKRPVEPAPEVPGRIEDPEVRELVAQTLEKLRMAPALAIAPGMGVGSRLRRELYGEGSDKGEG